MGLFEFFEDLVENSPERQHDREMKRLKEEKRKNEIKRQRQKEYFDEMDAKHFRRVNVDIDWDNIDNMELYELKALEKNIFFSEGFSKNYYRLQDIIIKRQTNNTIDKRKKSIEIDWDEIPNISINRLENLIGKVFLAEGFSDTYDKLQEILQQKFEEEMEEFEDDVDCNNKTNGDNEEEDDGINEPHKEGSNSWGEYGEKNVEYQIKWLGKEYKKIVKDCLKNDRSCILLKNDDYIEESQEIDHIVVSDKGVYVIETKHYKGVIEIRKNGNWIRVDDEGNERGVTNPIAQVDRHHVLIDSILGDSVEENDINDIICISHESAIIKGEDYSPIPVIKVDMLGRYIKKNDKNKESKYDADEIIDIIEQYKVTEE